MPIVKDLLILMLIANALAIMLFAWIGYHRWNDSDVIDGDGFGGPHR